MLYTTVYCIWYNNWAGKLSWLVNNINYLVFIVYSWPPILIGKFLVILAVCENCTSFLPLTLYTIVDILYGFIFVSKISIVSPDPYDVGTIMLSCSYVKLFQQNNLAVRSIRVSEYDAVAILLHISFILFLFLFCSLDENQ